MLESQAWSSHNLAESVCSTGGERVIDVLDCLDCGGAECDTMCN